MSINPLNDISKVYLEQVSVASRARNAVADDRLDAEQEKTNASMNKLRQQNKRFDRALASDAARKVERDVKKSSAYGPQRPKPGTVTGRRIEDPKPTGSKPKGYRVEETEIDEAQKPNDGNLANNYPPYDKITRGDVIAGRLGKDEMGGKKKKKVTKEGFSNWRQDLAEVMTDTESEIKIKEKKVNNKIKINPKLGESVEEIGGVILEMVEIDEVDFVVESVYDELLEEGYEEDDIEEALEYALTEATVTYGHDTPTGEKKRGNLVKAVGRLARQKLSSKVRSAKTAAKAAVARGARKVAKGALGVARKMEGGKEAPKTAARKPSTYRGAGAGTKEKVSSGSYTPPTKKKAEKPADPWEGSATTPKKAKPKAKDRLGPHSKSDEEIFGKPGSLTGVKTPSGEKPKAKAAAPKRKRKSKLDSLLADIRSESVQQIDELSVNKMHAYINKAEKDRDRLNKKWDQGTATPKERKKVFDREEGEARASKKIRQKTGKDSFRLNALDKLKSAVTKEETQLDEKALSKQQQKFMGMVYAVKKGDMEAPSPEVAKAAKSMTTQQAKDFAKTKHKGLPQVKEQMDDSTEMSSTSPVDDKKMEQQKRKIQMQKIKDLTVRLSAARKGVY